MRTAARSLNYSIAPRIPPGRLNRQGSMRRTKREERNEKREDRREKKERREERREMREERREKRGGKREERSEKGEERREKTSKTKLGHRSSEGQFWGLKSAPRSTKMRK